MRKFYARIFTLFVFVIAAAVVNAQTVSQYVFSQSNGTYTPITGGTVISSSATDDDNSYAVTLPFPFTFAGVSYTQVYVNTNGFLSFGPTAPAGATYSPISGTTAYGGAVAPLGRDLMSNNGNITWSVSGTSPFRVITFQWSNYTRYSAASYNELLNFQVQLFETTNNVSIVYGGFSANATSTTAQVGLRGATNADFNNRTSTTSWSATTAGSINTASVTYSSTITPASGLTFTWAPPPPCSGTPTAGTAAANPTSACLGGTTALSLTGSSTGVSGLTYQWQSSPDNINWTNISGATTSNYTATVSANTWYRAIVTCSTTGNSQTSTSVQVTVAGVGTVPYTESFESIAVAGTLPNCMTASPAISTTGKTRSYTANATTTNSALIARTGSKFVAVYWSPSNTSGYFFTQGIQLTGGVSYDASVWYKTDGVAWTTAGLYYGTSPTPAAMTNTIATASNAAATTYTEIKGSFIPPTTGIYYIAIQGFNATTAPNYIAFDDLSITLTPPCSAPSAVTVSNITSNSASVAFTSTGNSFIVEYGPTGFTPGTGASAGTGGTVVTGTASPIAITGLSSNTVYDIYVRQICSGPTYSPNSSIVSFTTACTAIPTPYFEGFNTSGTSVFPSCWTQQYVVGTSNITFQTNSSNPTTTPYEGTRYVYWNSYSIASGNETRLVSPPLNTTGNANVNVEFYMFNENSAYYTNLLEGVQVQYSLNGTTWVDAGTFFPRQDASLPVGTGQWKKKSLTLPAAAGNQPFIYVGFKFHSEFGDNVSIDAVNIGCVPPTVTSTTPGQRCGPGVVALSAAASGGTLNWYTTASGGTPVGTGTLFFTPVLNATTTYYVSASSTCESPRVAVLAIVNPGPTFSVSPASTVCNASIVPLTVTSTQTNFDSYTWTPTTGLFTDAAATIPYTGGSATTVYMKQTAAGTYTYVANANNSTTSCTGIDSVKVTVLPASVSLTASPSQICVSGSTTITSLTSGFGAATFQWYSSPNGITYTPITGATAAFYTTPTLTATTYYRLDIKNSSGTICLQPTITINVNTPQVLTTTPASNCGPGVLTLQATGSSGTTLNWYNSATGGNVLGTGGTFTTPNLTATTTYYVGALSGGTTFNVGLASDVAANLSSLGGYGMYFSTISAATINTVDIYPSTAGTLNVTLRNATNTIVDTRTFTITAADISTTVKKTLNLGFAVPAGSTGWQIYYDLAIYRGAGTYTYPSTNNGFSITGNTLDGDNITSGTRYYFYNWSVTTGCESPRVAVTATINVNTAITTQPQSQTACAGANVLLSVSAVGGNLTYQWQFNGTPITGATANTLTLNNVQTSNSGNYTVVITGTCGTVTSSVATLTVNPSNTWLGTVSSDWNTAANWCGNVPTPTSDVVIPSGTPFMPSVTGVSEARNVTVNAGASLTVAAGGRLDIYGNYANSGTLTAGSGIIAFKGAANQTVGAINAGTILMNGNGGITLGGNMSVSTALVLANGNITLGSNNLTVSGTVPGSVSSHIITNGTGSVISNNITANSVIIPVGPDAASYNPVVISNGQGANYTVRVATGITPTINDPSRAINRTWTITPSTSVSSGVQITYQYDDTHKNANAVPTNAMEVGVNNGTNWNVITGSGGITPIGTATARQVTVTTTLFGPTVIANVGGVNLTTAIPNIDIDIAGVTLMPNVVNGGSTVMRVNLRKAMRIDWMVVDAKGRVVMAFAKQYQAGQTDATLDLSKLAGGTYFISGYTSKGKAPLVRFIKM
ncbi:MAG: hypothetical protein C4330_01385 [Chitinophagaceae bacterium]